MSNANGEPIPTEVKKTLTQILVVKKHLVNLSFLSFLNTNSHLTPSANWCKSVKESAIIIWPWWWEQLRVMKVCKLWLQAKNAMSILCNTVSCPAWSVPSLGVAVPACAFAKPMIVLTPLNTIRGEDNEGSIARDLKCTALYEKRPWRRASVTYLGTLRWRLP